MGGGWALLELTDALHDLKSKQSIDRQACQEINYSSNLSDRSYCLWANRNFPLLVRREIRTRQLQLRARSLPFPLPPSLFSFISPRSSLAALCVFGSRALSTIQKVNASSLIRNQIAAHAQKSVKCPLSDCVFQQAGDNIFCII